MMSEQGVENPNTSKKRPYDDENNLLPLKKRIQFSCSDRVDEHPWSCSASRLIDTLDLKHNKETASFVMENKIPSSPSPPLMSIRKEGKKHGGGQGGLDDNEIQMQQVPLTTTDASKHGESRQDGEDLSQQGGSSDEQGGPKKTKHDRSEMAGESNPIDLDRQGSPMAVQQPTVNRKEGTEGGGDQAGHDDIDIQIQQVQFTDGRKDLKSRHEVEVLSQEGGSCNAQIAGESNSIEPCGDVDVSSLDQQPVVQQAKFRFRLFGVNINTSEEGEEDNEVRAIRGRLVKLFGGVIADPDQEDAKLQPTAAAKELEINE